MDFFERLKVIENMLIKLDCINKIYNVKNHTFRLKDLGPYHDFDKMPWQRVKLNYLTVLSALYKYIANDDYVVNDEKEVIDEIFDLYEEYRKIRISDFSNEQKELFIKTVLLLNLYACCAVSKGNPKYLNPQGFLTQKPSSCLYRGEDDYNYSLIPSIFRKMDVNKLIVFNYEKLFNYYNEKKLPNKYSQFLPFEGINYEFCSLMQHCGCNSPFIDLTLNPKAALSFACSSKQDVDGSIYVFDGIPTVSKNNEIVDIDVILTNRKLDLMTFIGEEPILFCGLDKFDVSAVIYTHKTNDRMKMQKGAFLFLRHCLIIDGHLLLPVNNKYIKKYRLKPEFKRDYLDLVSGTAEDVKYLMNPYDFFLNAKIE